MKSVRLEYFRFFFFRKNLNIEVPERWEDLSPRQFEICAAIHTREVFDIEFIHKFFGIKKRLAKRLTKFEQYKLIELAGFLSDPKAMVNFFYLENIPGTQLQSPSKKLHEMKFEHFMLFDTFFFDYLNDPKDENLLKFVASLYLKNKEIVTEIDFTKRIAYLSKNVDKSTLYAIFLNYTFIRKWLSKAFPLLFGFEDPDEEDKKASRRKNVNLPKKQNRPDWTSILEGFVGDDVINYDKYKQVACTVVFRTLNKRIATYNKYGNK